MYALSLIVKLDASVTVIPFVRLSIMQCFSLSFTKYKKL